MASLWITANIIRIKNNDIQLIKDAYVSGCEFIRKELTAKIKILKDGYLESELTIEELIKERNLYIDQLTEIRKKI